MNYFFRSCVTKTVDKIAQQGVQRVIKQIVEKISSNQCEACVKGSI